MSEITTQQFPTATSVAGTDTVLMNVNNGTRKVALDDVSSYICNNTYSLSGGTQIPDNTNFNTITDIGVYYVHTNSSAETMSNCPTNTAGVLTVENPVGVDNESAYNYRKQTYRLYIQPFTKYERLYTDTGETYSWGEWYINYDSVQKTGDTMTGDLNIQIRKGIFTTDASDNSFPLIINNGANVWIGANSTGNYHHGGGTIIDAGYNRTTLEGNDSIYVSVPDSTHSAATNYKVFHAGNALTHTVGTGAKSFSNLTLTTANQYYQCHSDPMSFKQGRHVIFIHFWGTWTSAVTNSALTVAIGSSSSDTVSALRKITFKTPAEAYASPVTKYVHWVDYITFSSDTNYYMWIASTIGGAVVSGNYTVDSLYLHE